MAVKNSPQNDSKQNLAIHSKDNNAGPSGSHPRSSELVQHSKQHVIPHVSSLMVKHIIASTEAEEIGSESLQS
jgi:hypothetical protein